MYTLNYVYENNDELKKFILKNNLKEQKNLLIQIFSGNLNKKFLITLLNTLKKSLPHANIIGSTTDGEIINCSILSNEVVISFSVFEKTSIKTYFFEKKGFSSAQLGEKINEKLTDSSKAAIILTDGLATNGERLIKNITKPVKIAGGFAGDNYFLKKTYVFSDKGLTDNGCVVAILEGKDLIVHNDYGLNWEGIGKVMTVTKSDNNGRVYELDNEPVKLVYRKYFGNLTDKYLLEIGMQFPLIMHRNGTKIARAVIGEDEDSLIYAGNVYEDEEVQFGYANLNDILAQNLNMFKKLENKPVESIFIYECTSRRKFLGNNVKYEYLSIADVSMSGFYSYGEFYGDDEKYFFNQTITYLALSESSESKIKIREFDFYKKDDFLVCQALTNLIKSTTVELREKTAQLKEIAQTDSLTKILNRKGCLESIKKLDEPYIMLLLDIDFFKSINDRYGHDVGDEVLTRVVDLIKSNIRQNDIFCRYGGEEFIIILPKVTLKNGVEIAEKLRKIIENNMILDNIKVTVSVGVSEFIDNFYCTFKQADNNLYKSKRNGRNRVTY